MVLAVKEDLGSVIEADQILNFVKSEKTEPLRGASLDSVLDLVSSGYTQETLLVEKEEIGSEESKTFPDLLNELKDNIAGQKLGSLLSAKTFLRLLDAARKATRDEISKVLGSKKYQKIL